MQGKDDWFVSNREAIDIGAEYEKKAIKGHKYYVKVKSLHLLKKTSEFFGNTEGIIALDLGCGTGETIEYFQDRFYHVIGCDSSEGMLRYASYKKMKNITLKQCDAEALPFKETSIDLITMFGLIHHIDSRNRINKIFNEVYRVLKIGGMIAVYDFNPYNPISRYIVKTCPIDVGVNLDGYKRSKFPTTFYPYELMEILRDSGLTTIKIEYLIFFPKPLSFFLPLERFLSKVPLGGMYSLIGKK